MAYYKTGCNWGSGQPDFYELIRKHSIVICERREMQKGDIVAIAKGHEIVALARLISEQYPCTSKPELKIDFDSYEVDFEDWNLIADAQIWELPAKFRFKYQLQQGICEIRSSEIKDRIDTIIQLIMGQKIVSDCTKLLLGNYNIILTGAPGTGKTYLAKEIAKSLGATDDTLEFVQFHPSYDYTDFVEGLRPLKTDGTLGFQRKDGVFKAFCKRAIEEGFMTKVKAQFDSLWKEIDEGRTKELLLYSNKKSRQMIVESKNKGTIHFAQENNSDAISKGNDVTINDVYTIIRDKHLDTIDAIMEANPDRETLGVNGNPSNKWAVCRYILEKIKDEPKQPYVFIIDEINRGEISKIFGELFYSIEPGYRGVKGLVKTQYQNLIPNERDNDYDLNKNSEADVFRNGFYVPENVYIIGTMNDIDRSVESMDFAMRRRFAWKEITPKSRQSMLDDDQAWNGKKPTQIIIDEIKARMDNLNACIIDQYGNEELSSKDKIGLTQAYQIGAAYFLKYANYNDFNELWDNHLKGLLYEYLRGKPDIDKKIKRLEKAYNDPTPHIKKTIAP